MKLAVIACTAPAPAPGGTLLVMLAGNKHTHCLANLVGKCAMLATNAHEPHDPTKHWHVLRQRKQN